MCEQEAGREEAKRMWESINTCTWGVADKPQLTLAALQKEASMPFQPNPDGTWREVQSTADPTVIRPSVPDKDVPESEKQATKEQALAALAASGRNDNLVRWWNSAMSILGRRDDRI